MKAEDIFEFPNPPGTAGPPASQRRKGNNRIEKPMGLDKIGKGSSWADMENYIGPVSWGWKPWLPNGMLTIIAADSGIGKSALALRVAACYLRGDPWPDGTPFDGKPGEVLWCEAEAAQAIHLDRAKLWKLPLDKLLTPLASPLEDVYLDSPDHQMAIATIARRDDVRLIIVDSLRGAHRGDENKSDAITVVKWLAELARDTGKPVILTHHLRKPGQGENNTAVTLDRLRGSSAIVQTARVVWALDTPDSANNECRRLSVIKNNLSRFPEPLGLTINDAGVTFGAAPEPPRRETLQDRAGDLLKAILAKGPVLATAIENQVNQAGLSWNAAKRAKDKLGIVSFREKGAWFWRLPDK